MNTTQGMKRARWRLGALGLVGLAWLAPGAQAVEGPVEEIVITGSRIAAPNMSSTSPVQVVSDEEIQHLGKTDMVDILNTLPQVFQNSATDFSNTSNSLSTPGGLTTVNLRGLGPQRTLVLVDGRRLGTADANTGNPNPAPNLDQIPVALIERVDVVTGGASAVYGSDAVAGVVNFIMRKNFEGVQIDAQYGFNQHENDNGFMQGLASDAGLTVADGGSTDGENMSVSAIGGTNIADGRGNFTAYLTYRQADPINGADRDFAGCQLFTALPDSSFCGGSSNSNFFRPVISQTPYSVVGDQFVPYPADSSSPPASFNSNQFVNMSRDDTRYMAGFMAHVTMNDYAEPYAEFGFMNDKTEVVIAPSGLFRGSNPLTADTQYLVNCSNPLLSDQQRAILCTPEQVAADLANPGSTSVSVEIGRRNIEGGGRVAEFEHTNYRGVLGVRGDLGPAWSYDAYGQYYYSTLYNSNSNYLNFQSIANGMQVTGTRDESGMRQRRRLRAVQHLHRGRRDGGAAQLPVHPGHGVRHRDPAGRARRRDGRPGRVRTDGAARAGGDQRQLRARATDRRPDLRSGLGGTLRPAGGILRRIGTDRRRILGGRGVRRDSHPAGAGGDRDL